MYIYIHTYILACMHTYVHSYTHIEGIFRKKVEIGIFIKPQPVTLIKTMLYGQVLDGSHHPFHTSRADHGDGVS